MTPFRTRTPVKLVRFRALAGLAAAAVLAGGCSGYQPRRMTFAGFYPARPALAGNPLAAGDGQPRFAIATLGAGDALGRSIYVNDIVLAAAIEIQQRREGVDRPAATVADAPTH